MTMDYSAVKDTIIHICQKAGEKLHRYFESGEFIHTSKGGLDFLTQADAETDEYLRKEIKKTFPQTELLTEETFAGSFAPFRHKESVWIIDPIDGTTNFSRGDSHCAISVGLVHKDVTVVGVVHLPFENKTYWATIDGESYCNDEELHVSGINNLGVSSVGYDWSWDTKERMRMFQSLRKFVPHVRQPLSMGSAASDICLVAEGRLDGYFIYGLKPWDHAAASLILTNAGGKVTKIDGSEWNVFDSEILATNGLIHQQMKTIIK